MSADSPSAADRIARFAELVEAVDVAGVEVLDYDTTRLVESGDLQGTIDLRVGDVPESDATDRSEDEPADEEWAIEGGELQSVSIGCDSLDDDEVPDHLKEGEQHEVRPTDDAASSVMADQEDVDVPAESDVAPADLEDDEDEIDAVEEATDKPEETTPDYVVERPRPDNEEEDALTEEIVSILEAEGEMRSSELRDRVDGNRTEFYDACDELKEADRLSVRDDPDDGRRKLYSLADHEEDDGPEWNGRDPEAIVADSSLPARVVLEDILDAVAAADTLIEAAESLDVDVDNLEPVCWELTLKKPGSYEVVDDVGEQITKIREVAA